MAMGPLGEERDRRAFQAACNQDKVENSRLRPGSPESEAGRFTKAKLCRTLNEPLETKAPFLGHIGVWSFRYSMGGFGALQLGSFAPEAPQKIRSGVLLYIFGETYARGLKVLWVTLFNDSALILARSGAQI